MYNTNKQLLCVCVIPFLRSSTYLYPDVLPLFGERPKKAHLLDSKQPLNQGVPTYPRLLRVSTAIDSFAPSRSH